MSLFPTMPTLCFQGVASNESLFSVAKVYLLLHSSPLPTLDFMTTFPIPHGVFNLLKNTVGITILHVPKTFSKKNKTL